MKTQTFKSVEHEVGYVAGVTVVFVVLSLVVFPLFILLLPIAIYAGARDIWNLDHPHDKDKT